MPKRNATRAGLDRGEMAGHSLRVGLVTSAVAPGMPERVIANQTGHKGTAMLQRYTPGGIAGSVRTPRTLFGLGGEGGWLAIARRIQS
jgi:hypothetical protein